MIMKIIEKCHPDDNGTYSDVGRRNLDSKGLGFFLFLILLSLATRLPDCIPYLKHKIRLSDAKSMVEVGNKYRAKQILADILSNSKNKNVIAEALYLKHKIWLSDAKDMVKVGNKSQAKQILADILNNSKDKDIIAEAMYLKVLYRLTSNDMETFRELKAFSPNSKYVGRLEAVFERAKGLRKKFTGEFKKLTQEFVYIQPGTFIMGSQPNEPGQTHDEKQHSVTLTKGFYMQATEVTQGEWEAVMGNNPSYFKNCGNDCPVEQVSWNDVQEFLKELNQHVGHGTTYRLPTESEWEYAARAGTDTPFSYGKCLSTDQANYEGSSPLPRCPKGKDRQSTIPVASLLPNPWGLYDMHGNVFEWCQDFIGGYPSGSVTNPIGESRAHGRVVRGGDYSGWAKHCRSARRGYFFPDTKKKGLGFRLVRNP